MLSIIYGIASSLSWGGGDFAGGLSSRRIGAYRAVFYADFLGLLVLFAVLGVYREPFPSASGWANALIGGALGSLGLLMLYYSLSIGRMSIAAPATALFAAVLPVIFSALTEGLPTYTQFIGFGLALAAIWMIANADGGFQIDQLSDLKFPLLAGLGFGSYFIFIHNAAAEPGALLWPLILSRVAGTVLLFFVVLVRRESFAIPRNVWGIAWTNAVLDLAGNFFFILASKSGRLDIASILSSLYPGATVVLAWLVLKEQITRRQWVGILLALGAITLFAL
ncbi:MAG TPA: EamA family transporter [Anaerolineae bacterium]|nr:EamA family transporter [Anaerolineae bacterium]